MTRFIDTLLETRYKFSLYLMVGLFLSFSSGWSSDRSVAEPCEPVFVKPRSYSDGTPTPARDILSQAFTAISKPEIHAGTLELRGFILIETPEEKLSVNVVVDKKIETFFELVSKILTQTDFEWKVIDKVVIITPPNYAQSDIETPKKPLPEKYHGYFIPSYRCSRKSAATFSDEINAISESVLDYFEIDHLPVERRDPNILISSVLVWLPIRDIQSITSSF